MRSARSLSTLRSSSRSRILAVWLAGVVAGAVLVTGANTLSPRVAKAASLQTRSASCLALNFHPLDDDTDWKVVNQLTFSQQTVLSPQLLHEVRFMFGVEYEPRLSVVAAPRVVVLDAFTGGGAQGDQLRTEHHFTLTEMLTWSAGRHTVKWGMNIPDWSRRRFDARPGVGGDAGHGSSWAAMA